MKAFIRTCFVVLGVVIISSGCISFAPQATNDLPVSGKNKIEDKKVEEPAKEITFVISPGQLDFDPLHAYSSTECQLYTAIYEGLVTYNPLTLEPVPGIARYWETSEDGLVYTFYLRDGLVFSNGDGIKAEDVRCSWLRMIDPRHKAEYSVFFDVIKGVKEYKSNPDLGWDTVGIKAVDEKTLEVTLSKPASHFLKLLCHMSFIVLHPKYRNDEDWGQKTAIIADGPFIMIERNEKRIVLVKNNLYWDACNVKLDKITVQFSNDAKQTAGLFNSGTVQWALNADLDTIKDKASLILNPMFSTTYFYFNCNTPPFDNPNVRRGLALLLPWDEIRSKDYLFTAETLVPRISGYPEIAGICKQNEEEGMKLLRDAGLVEDDGSMPVITINISDDSDSKKLAGILKKAWEAIPGFKVNIACLDSDKYFKSLKNDSYTLGMMSWIGDFADPLTFLQMWTTGSNLNDAKFENNEYDALIDESLKDCGKEKYDVLGKAEKIILDGAAVLPIRRHPAFNIVNLRIIDGWYPNVLDIHPFKYLRFRQDEILQNLTMASPNGVHIAS